MEETNEYLRALKRGWPIVIIAILLGIASVFLTTPAKPAPEQRSYTATNTLLLTGNNGGNVGTISFNQIPLFATTGEVPKRVAERLKESGPPAALASQVQVSVDGGTSTVRFTTTQKDPDRAVSVADAFADETVKFLAQKQDEVRSARLAGSLGRLTELENQVNDFDKKLRTDPENPILKAQRDAAVRNYSTAYEEDQSLRSQSSDLGLTELERAQPVPISTGGGFKAPKSRSARMPLAAIVGGVLGLGLVIVMDRFDGRIRDRRRAEQALNAPVVGELPTMKRTERGLTVQVRPDSHTTTAEAFRTLRTALTFLAHGDDHTLTTDGPVGVVLVSSPSPSDGKTTVAANIAAAFAETGRTVVVVNADFRRPRVGKYFTTGERQPLPGLEYLYRVPAEQFLVPTTVPRVRLLDLAGLDAPPGDLARASARLVAVLRSTVDVIVIDTPPLSVTAEALEFAPEASITLIVARVSRTRIRSAIRASEMMRFSGSTALAVALTDAGLPSRRRHRYYGYYYRPGTDGSGSDGPDSPLLDVSEAGANGHRDGTPVGVGASASATATSASATGPAPATPGLPEPFADWRTEEE